MEMCPSMTLEEQLRSMAGTSSERQLIERWLRRAPSQSGSQLASSRAMIGTDPAPESAHVDSPSPTPAQPST